MSEQPSSERVIQVYYGRAIIIQSKLIIVVLVDLQKARLARIRLAKATSGAAFLSKKRAVESRLLAQESGLGMDENGEDHWLREEDIFELQHHHLLRCLEKATVSCSASFDYWPDTSDE